MRSLMKKYATLWILIVLAPLNCAFDWGFGVKDTCGEAKRIVAKLDGIANADERNKAEKRVVQLCPDGAAGHYISALNRERKGDGDGALAEYRAALQADTAFPEAHGNVGLILLRKGMYDEAAVELTLALRGHPDPRYDQGLAKIY